MMGGDAMDDGTLSRKRSAEDIFDGPEENDMQLGGAAHSYDGTWISDEAEIQGMVDDAVKQQKTTSTTLHITKELKNSFSCMLSEMYQESLVPRSLSETYSNSNRNSGSSSSSSSNNNAGISSARKPAPSYYNDAAVQVNVGGVLPSTRDLLIEKGFLSNAPVEAESSGVIADDDDDDDDKELLVVLPALYDPLALAKALRSIHRHLKSITDKEKEAYNYTSTDERFTMLRKTNDTIGRMAQCLNGRTKCNLPVSEETMSECLLKFASSSPYQWKKFSYGTFLPSSVTLQAKSRQGGCLLNASIQTCNLHANASTCIALGAKLLPMTTGKMTPTEYFVLTKQVQRCFEFHVSSDGTKIDPSLIFDQLRGESDGHVDADSRALSYKLQVRKMDTEKERLAAFEHLLADEVIVWYMVHFEHGKKIACIPAVYYVRSPTIAVILSHERVTDLAMVMAGVKRLTQNEDSASVQAASVGLLSKEPQMYATCYGDVANQIDPLVQVATKCLYFGDVYPDWLVFRVLGQSHCVKSHRNAFTRTMLLVCTPWPELTDKSDVFLLELYARALQIYTSQQGEASAAKAGFQHEEDEDEDEGVAAVLGGGSRQKEKIVWVPVHFYIHLAEPFLAYQHHEGGPRVMDPKLSTAWIDAVSKGGTWGKMVVSWAALFHSQKMITECRGIVDWLQQALRLGEDEFRDFENSTGLNHPQVIGAIYAMMALEPIRNDFDRWYDVQNSRDKDAEGITGLNQQGAKYMAATASNVDMRSVMRAPSRRYANQRELIKQQGGIPQMAKSLKLRCLSSQTLFTINQSCWATSSFVVHYELVTLQGMKNSMLLKYITDDFCEQLFRRLKSFFSPPFDAKKARIALSRMSALLRLRGAQWVLQNLHEVGFDPKQLRKAAPICSPKPARNQGNVRGRDDEDAEELVQDIRIVSQSLKYRASAKKTRVAQASRPGSEGNELYMAKRLLVDLMNCMNRG